MITLAGLNTFILSMYVRVIHIVMVGYIAVYNLCSILFSNTQQVPKILSGLGVDMSKLFICIIIGRRIGLFAVNTVHWLTQYLILVFHPVMQKQAIIGKRKTCGKVSHPFFLFISYIHHNFPEITSLYIYIAY